MKHKWLRNFDADGNWTKPERVIVVDGVEHDLDKYAKEHGIELPSKPTKHTKHTKKADLEVNSNADMEQQDGSGDTEES